MDRAHTTDANVAPARVQCDRSANSIGARLAVQVAVHCEISGFKSIQKLRRIAGVRGLDDSGEYAILPVGIGGADNFKSGQVHSRAENPLPAFGNPASRDVARKSLRFKNTASKMNGHVGWHVAHEHVKL